MTTLLLAYPNFDKNIGRSHCFSLETDVSKLDLGAILSQTQNDNRLHSVAYASRSVSTSETNYAISDLETLAVVRVVTHFRYNFFMVLIMQHILGAPNFTERHARWWSNV